MVTLDTCILGNSELHDRFFATTEILAKLVSSAPRAVSLAQLEQKTGRSPRELGKLCRNLATAGLLQQDAAGKWLLTCVPSVVTLEDVFRCVLNEPAAARKAARPAAVEREASDVDVLVMQAMLAINQSVFKHLRQFSLDRLKISAAGMFPAPRRVLRDASLDDDFAFSGREAGQYETAQSAA